jgi:bifunctional non-homologous end joining protein LigD
MKRRKAKRGTQTSKSGTNRDLRLMRKSKSLAQGRGATEGALSKAPRAALPPFVMPCLATLVDKAPDDKRWVHEIKFDGYRLQARLDRGKVKLLTRKGLDWTARFSAVAQAIAKLRA